MRDKKGKKLALPLQNQNIYMTLYWTSNILHGAPIGKRDFLDFMDQMR